MKRNRQSYMSNEKRLRITRSLFAIWRLDANTIRGFQFIIYKLFVFFIQYNVFLSNGI